MIEDFSTLTHLNRKPALPPLASLLSLIPGYHSFISTMETETLASRNVVDWLLKEEYDAAICPPKTYVTSDEEGGVPVQEKAKGGFVYGWDC